jgi:quercetin dioxygenase-like cupin family protein
MTSLLDPGEPAALDELLTSAGQGRVSRVLARSAAGNVTAFAFDSGHGLSEHKTAFDVLVVTLSGLLTFTIGGREVQAPPHTALLLPANVPHAVFAVEPSRMVLIALAE